MYCFHRYTYGKWYVDLTILSKSCQAKLGCMSPCLSSNKHDVIERFCDREDSYSHILTQCTVWHSNQEVSMSNDGRTCLRSERLGSTPYSSTRYTISGVLDSNPAGSTHGLAKPNDPCLASMDNGSIRALVIIPAIMPISFCDHRTGGRKGCAASRRRSIVQPADTQAISHILY